MVEPEPYLSRINDHAQLLTQDLELALDAIEGLHTRIYLADPSLRGLGRFARAAQSHVDSAERIALRAFYAFWADVRPLLGDVTRPDVTVATTQLRNAMATAVGQSLQKFRTRLVSRTSVVAHNIDLRILNRAGARVKASNMIHLISRKGMLDLVNETRLLLLAADGHDQAQIYHADPAHASHGLVFALNGDAPTYLDLEAEFHPLSSAIVGAVSSVHS